MAIETAEQRVRQESVLHWLCYMNGAIERRKGEWVLNAACAGRYGPTAWDLHRDQMIKILDRSEASDPLLVSLLDALEANMGDAASLAALEDYLHDQEPLPFRGGSLPNWLRLIWLRKSPKAPRPMWWSGAAGDVRDAINEYLRKGTNHHLDHTGRVRIAGRDAYASDPYATHTKVRDQAKVIRDLLGIVAVGLPQGAWNPTTCRLLIFKPNQLPPPKRKAKR